MREYYNKTALGAVLGYGGAIMTQNDGSSLSNCDIYNIGGIGAVVVDTAMAFSGPSSIKITSNAAGLGETNYEGIAVACAYAQAGKVRVSCKFRGIDANAEEQFWMGLGIYEGGVGKWVEVGYIHAGVNYGLYYMDSAGDNQLIELYIPGVREDIWHVMEVEIDLVAKKYVGMRFNGRSYNLSAHGTAQANAFTYMQALIVDINVVSTSAADAVFYVDEIFCEAL